MPCGKMVCYLKGMKMKTKRIITGLIMIVVFAGLIACPALARKYDTMMVGPDRWIDVGYEDVQCEPVAEIVTNEEVIAYKGGDNEEPSVTTYDGQLEPNAITLVYYPAAEHPEHPNDINIDEELEPNMVVFRLSGEHPEHPNSIDYEEDVEPNLMLIYHQAEYPEHPEEPNEISNEEELDPNDIEKIILDQGTANLRRKNPEIAKTS